MIESTVVRLRCSADDGSPEHVRLDLHLPLQMDYFSTVLRRNEKCTCGKAMAIMKQGVRCKMRRQSKP